MDRTRRILQLLFLALRLSYHLVLRQLLRWEVALRSMLHRVWYGPDSHENR